MLRNLAGGGDQGPHRQDGQGAEGYHPGGAAGVIHAVDCPVTDCQPNDNVEALRVYMLEKKVEARPVWNRRSEREQRPSPAWAMPSRKEEKL